MSALSVSISCKKGICAILFSQDGKILFRSVTGIPSEVSGIYDSLTHCMTKALLLLKGYVEDTEDSSGVGEVVIECNNTRFIHWVEQGYTNEEYMDSFSKMLEVLDSIPIVFSFCYCKTPKASLYAKREYLTKPRLSGLDIDSYIDD